MATRSQKAFKLRALLLTLTCVIAFTFLLPTSHAQPHLDWVRRYSLNPAQTNQTKTLALAKDGGLIVAGASYAPLDQNDLDYYVVKYNSGGDTAWSLRFNSFDTLHDVVRAMTVDTNGNIYVTGTSDTVAISPTGQLLWDTNIPGKAIATYSTNALYVVGFSETDLTVSSLDQISGAPVWTRNKDGGVNRADTSDQIALDANGNVFVVGPATFSCAGSGSREVCVQAVAVAKYTPSGGFLWLQFAGITGQASTVSAGVDPSGRLFALLNTVPFAWEWIESNGARNGYQGGNPGGRATAMTMDSEGFVYATGAGHLGRPGYPDFRITASTCKVKADGTMAWSTDIQNMDQIEGEAIALDSKKNIYVAGTIVREGLTNDIFVAKYDSAGTILWTNYYDGPAHGVDIATGIVLDASNNIYITGYSQTAQGGTEFVTLKYSQPATASIERQPSDSIRINFLTAPNTPYILQATTNYFDWTSILTNTADPAGLVQFDDPTPTLPLRLYRGAKPQ